jgi:NET1-associated nuclear protein 1 (U3 small nucleolar RNA-associated protein 17)
VTSAIGDWLVTIDSREAVDNFRGEIYMKMWQWDQKLGNWILNTRIDRPHGLSRVTSLVFDPCIADPHASQLVSTGEDGTIKTWRLRSAKAENGDLECES